MDCEQAEGDPELRDPRRERGVDGEQGEVAGGAEIGGEGALGDRRGDAGDGDDREQGHLEAGVEEAGRVGGEQAERGEADGVKGSPLTPDEAAEQVEGDHPEGTLYRLAEAGENRVGEGGGDGEERGREPREPDALGEPEDDSGEDGEMEAGDDEQMEGTGALEADAGALLKPFAVAGNHGGEHGGVLGGEGQECRETRFLAGGRAWAALGEGHDSFAAGLLEGLETTGEGGVFGRSDEDRGGRSGAGEGADSLLEQVGGGVPDAGIVVAFRAVDGGGDAEGVSAAEFGKGLAGRCV